MRGAIVKCGSTITLYTNNGLSSQGVNTSYTLGNALASTVEHYHGIPTRYYTPKSGSPAMQDLRLTWNYQNGNLTQRRDEAGAVSRIENFTYDGLDRLITATVVTSAEQSFDAWGRRRNPTTWDPLAPTAVTGLPYWLIRVYTGHEHMDQFGLINMNGRLYDPALGRVLSADNFVQDPFSTQSFNRYSYVLNNPLSYNDPDGHFWNFVIGGVLGGISGWQIGKAQGAKGWGMAGYIFAGAGIGVATAGIGNAVVGSFSGAAQAGLGGTWASVGAYAAGAATAGAFSGGAFAALGGQNVGKGALTGALFGGVGGALGGYLKADKFARSIGNKANWLADCPECADMFPNEKGIWLDDKVVVYDTPIPKLTMDFPPTVRYGTPGPLMDFVSGVGMAASVSKSLYHLHHSYPKFLGGLKNQPLTKMTVEAHKMLHKEMNVFLKEFGMAPSKINSGVKIRNTFSIHEIQRVISDFYKGPGAKYTNAAKDFFNQIGF